MNEISLQQVFWAGFLGAIIVNIPIFVKLIFVLLDDFKK